MSINSIAYRIQLCSLYSMQWLGGPCKDIFSLCFFEGLCVYSVPVHSAHILLAMSILQEEEPVQEEVRIFAAKNSIRLPCLRLLVCACAFFALGLGNYYLRVKVYLRRIGTHLLTPTCGL
ncbi:unnamed protein product, partial [Discosporangium mesarthrocarpum]